MLILDQKFHEKTDRRQHLLQHHSTSTSGKKKIKTFYHLILVQCSAAPLATT